MTGSRSGLKVTGSMGLLVNMVLFNRQEALV